MTAEKTRLPVYFHATSELDRQVLNKVTSGELSKSDQMKKLALAGALLDNEGLLDIFLSTAKSKGLKRALMVSSEFIEEDPIESKKTGIETLFHADHDSQSAPPITPGDEPLIPNPATDERKQVIASSLLKSKISKQF
jgi:hypothetical protein